MTITTTSLTRGAQHFLTLLEKIGVTGVCNRQTGNYQVMNATPAWLALMLSQHFMLDERSMEKK